MVKRFLVAILAGFAAVLVLGATPMPLGPGAGSYHDYEPSVLLPDTVYVPIGGQCNIFYDQLWPVWPGENSANYYVTTTTYSGLTNSEGPQARSFRFSPATARSVPLIIRAVDPTGNTIASGTTVLRSVSKTSGYEERNVLLVGDSLMHSHASTSTPQVPDSNAISAYLLELVNADGGGKVRLLGTHGAALNQHEGWIGKSWVWFAYSESPFYRSATSKLDFKNWMSTTGQGSGPIDYCVAMLAINESFVVDHLFTASELAAETAAIDTFCTRLLSSYTGYPSCKIVLALEPPGCGDISAFGASYSSGPYQERLLTYLKNMQTIHRAIISRYDNGAYNANVSVCAANLWVDRYGGYQSVRQAMSNRAYTYRDSVTSYLNYVHPAKGGYYQIADAFYGHLRALRRSEVRVNYCSDTEDFAGWTKSGFGATDSTMTAPDGQVDALRFPTTGGGSAYMYVSGGTQAAENVFSLHIHLGPGNATFQGRIGMLVVGGTNSTHDFNIASGNVVTEPGGADANFGYSLEANGWVRVYWHHSETDDIGKAVNAAFYEISGTAGKHFGIFGAQMEHGALVPGYYRKVE